MTTSTTTCDRLIAGVAKRNAGLLVMADKAAILIISDPANLAGRAITLLDAMQGVRAQRNLREFFGDFLQNEVVEKKGGGFILGKKRQEWNPPTLPEGGLTPTTYANAAKAALAKAERAEKAAASREKREADKEAAIAAQSQREKSLSERERALNSRIENIRAICSEKVNVAEQATLDVQKALKAEGDRLKVALSEKARLEKELNAANSRIAELERELEAMRQVIASTVPAAPAVPATSRKRGKRA